MLSSNLSLSTVCQLRFLLIHFSLICRADLVAPHFFLQSNRQDRTLFNLLYEVSNHVYYSSEHFLCMEGGASIIVTVVTQISALH